MTPRKPRRESAPDPIKKAMPLHVLQETAKVTLLVFGMMVLADLAHTVMRGRVSTLLVGGPWRAYVVAAFLGALPGCLGNFLNVSFYMHGLIPFGALAGGMIAGSGDEAFVMLAMFPRQAVLLFGMLFVLGLFAGKPCDWWAGPFRIRPCPECPRQEYHAGREGLRHYLLEHVWRHIVVQHLWRVVLWTFGALLLVDLGLSRWDLQGWVEQHHGSLLLLAGFTGLIPESGPHLVFVTLYARGHLPFSVLLASSIVQDGHGMLPLLSYSVRDAALIKLFNLMVGLALGLALRAVGL